MTLKIGNMEERISPEDMARAWDAIELINRNGGCRTYAFNITSDTSHRGRKQ